MTNEELVKALKSLANGIWKNCKYTWFGGEEKVLANAAAAIEELQAMLTEADKKQAYQHDYICELVAEVEELKAAQPKRGKWEREMDVNDEPFYQCSVCGECFDFNRDSTHEVFKYCPNCGAVMEDMCEVHDV